MLSAGYPRLVKRRAAPPAGDVSFGETVHDLDPSRPRTASPCQLPGGMVSPDEISATSSSARCLISEGSA